MTCTKACSEHHTFDYDCGMGPRQEYDMSEEQGIQTSFDLVDMGINVGEGESVDIDSEHPWEKAARLEASEPRMGMNPYPMTNEPPEYEGQGIAEMVLPTEGDYDRAPGLGEEQGPWIVVTHESGARDIILRTEGELLNGLDQSHLVLRHIGPGGRVIQSFVPQDRIVAIHALEEELLRWADDEEGPEETVPFRRPKAGE